MTMMTKPLFLLSQCNVDRSVTRSELERSCGTWDLQLLAYLPQRLLEDAGDLHL